MPTENGKSSFQPLCVQVSSLNLENTSERRRLPNQPSLGQSHLLSAEVPWRDSYQPSWPFGPKKSDIWVESVISRAHPPSHIILLNLPSFLQKQAHLHAAILLLQSQGVASQFWTRNNSTVTTKTCSLFPRQMRHLAHFGSEDTQLVPVNPKVLHGIIQVRHCLPSARGSLDITDACLHITIFHPHQRYLQKKVSEDPLRKSHDHDNTCREEPGAVVVPKPEVTREPWPRCLYLSNCNCNFI